VYIKIPINKLPNRGSNKQIDMEYKWSDNMQNGSDPLDWYINGDAAQGEDSLLLSKTDMFY
jgi:hypothetical protein